MGLAVVRRFLLVACVVVGVLGLPGVAAGSPAVARDRAVTASELSALPSSSQRAGGSEAAVGDMSRPPGVVSGAGFDPERSTLLSERTTADRRVWRNEDGTETWELSASPVRTRDEHGQWVDVDWRATRSADGGFAPRRGSTDTGVRLGARAGRDMIRVDTDAGVVSFANPAAGPAAAELRADGGAVVYPRAVENDGSLEVRFTPGGFEQSLVVGSAEGPAGWTDELSLPSGTRVEQSGADVVLLRGEEVLARYGDGVGFDSAEPRAVAPVTVTVVGQRAGSATLSVAVDAAWLRDPARVFPVTIDPTWESAPVGGWESQWITSGGSSAPGLLRIGTDGSGVNRTLLRFPNVPTTGITWVTEAHITLLNYSSQTCGTRAYTTNRLLGAFTSSTTWATQPSYTTGDVSQVPGFNAPGCGYGAVAMNFNATQTVNVWVQGSPNYGVMLDDGMSGDLRMFHGRLQTLPPPTLSFTFYGGTGESTPQSPTDGSLVRTVSPTLTSSTAVDPENDPVQYWYKIATSPSFGTGQVVNSGWLSSPSWSVPAGSLLDGGTYYWSVWTSDGGVAVPSSETRSFVVDLALGAQPALPFDAYGDVAVNLTTGNLVASHASAQFATVAGPVGVSFTYNSQAPSVQGLRGTYYDDSGDGSHSIELDEHPSLVRVDPQVSFDWGSTSPIPGTTTAEDTFIRWEGFVTVPATGSYQFGATHNDGVRVWVDGTQVVNRWFDSYTTVPAYGSSVSLTAGQSVPIKVEYFNNTVPASIALYVKGAVAEQVVPSSWLSVAPAVLPTGWSLTAGNGGGTAYVGLRQFEDRVDLLTASGAVVSYNKPTGGSGWVPPAGYDGVLSPATDGTLTLFEGDSTYTFDVDGHVTSATSVLDDRRPAAAQFTRTGTPSKLTTITDPVSSRAITLRYSGDAACPTNPPAGFDAAAPVGMLCQIDYWDGTATIVRYASGLLARIEDPGGVVTDYGYTNGQLTSTRTPLAAESIAAGVRADDATTRTAIAYDSDRRVSSVTLPAPTTGAARPGHSYQYFPTVPSAGVSERRILVGGLTMPFGYWRRVEIDNRGRVTRDWDANANSTTQTWAPDRDLLLSSTDQAAQTTTYTYDTLDRPTRTDYPNNGGTAAQTAEYDVGLYGLAAAYWPNTTMTGAPLVHGLGLGGSSNGAINSTWNNTTPMTGLSPGAWTVRLAGDIQTQEQVLRVVYDGRVRVWVNDRLVVDAWTTPANTSVTFTGTSSSGRSRLRIDYQPTSATQGRLRLERNNTNLLPGSELSPRLGLTTATSELDGLFTTRRTTIAYGQPITGQATGTTVDAGGLYLTTSTGYEPDQTGSYNRRISRQLPAGNTTGYNYWGAGSNPASTANPCIGGSPAVHQAGLVRGRLGPDPDGKGPLTAPQLNEVVYDAAGRVVASHQGTDPWTCTTYDSRGRVTSQSIPAFGSEAARTVTYTHAVAGNPLVTRVTDPAGSVSTTVDLLGRTIAYTDVWNNTTTSTYDTTGRLTDTNGPAGSRHYDYDPAGRQTSEKLDAKTVATLSYDTWGRLSNITYPAASGTTTGNGTQLSAIGYDPGSRPTSFTWLQAGGALLTSDTVTRTPLGRVIDENIDGTDPNPAGANYVYDGAGRLSTAIVPGHTYSYNFGANSCGTASAGRDTNRTSMTDNGVATTYCYNDQDQLTSTTAPGYGTIAYDTHGNTTTLGSQTLTYDAADRHLQTTTGATTVRYVRDALDRIVSRSVNGAVQARYGHTGPTDASSIVQNTSGTTIERTISLPGGVLLTKRNTGDVWSYPNIHGDIVATANATGIKQGATVQYDPYGTPLTAAVDNSAGNYDYGWLGQHQRGLEHEAGSGIIEMGARSYDPVLGRFLEVDPVEGGCLNDYEYAKGDPVNYVDLTGSVACPTSGHSITIRGQYGFEVKISNKGGNRFDVKANYAGLAGLFNFWRAEDTWIQIKGRRTNGSRFNSGIVQTSDKIAGGRAGYPISWGHVGAPALASGSTLDVTAWSPWARWAWLPNPAAPVVVTGVMVNYSCTVR